MDFGDGDAETNLDAGANGCAEQNFVQLQSRQRAERRHPVVSEQEFVLDDQPSAWVEQIHPVIAEARGEHLFEHAERIVDAERIRGLAQPNAGYVKRWPPLDQDGLYALPCECRSGCQSADTASDHQNASNVAHDRPFRCPQRRSWNDTRAASMTAPPSAWIGVMTSPSIGALTMVEHSGSTNITSAVRNGPMRLIEVNSARMPMVVPTLTPISAAQPVVP